MPVDWTCLPDKQKEEEKIDSDQKEEEKKDYSLTEEDIARM